MAMNYLEIIGTIIGLLYLWLEYRASIYLWIAGIIMPAIYIFVYYKAGLYADFGINIYYLLAAVYGWIIWKYGRIADHPYPIEISSAINSRIHNRPFGHCLDTDKLYRQHCSLARLFHHSIEHCRHVDARP